MANAKKNSPKGKEPKHGQGPDDGSEGFDDNIRLGAVGDALFTRAGVAGIALLAAGVGLGASRGDHFQQFFHSYLVAFMWSLAITLGALWWVTLQHLVNAKWSIVVRRVGELLASNMILMAILALPIIADMADGHSALYIWVDQHKVHEDHLLHHKAPYLNFGFFVVRCLIYFGFWTLLARYFLNRSLRQDSGGDATLVDGMRKASAPGMIAIALTLTFAAFDFLMSLEPAWFSTIFGVYYFAGCVMSWHSALALTLIWLQSRGRLVKSVTAEHYHDIGKMMFAFVIFWSYIGFSQFMLIYYANVPEETFWFKERLNGGWANVSWLLLFGHFAVPFFYLLSRHIKRNKKLLGIGAVWLLFIEYVDMYWIVMPKLHADGPAPGLIDFCCWSGMACLLVAGAAFHARGKNLLPTKDPRLSQSLSFENI
jgi:hypothetical protein